MSRTEVTDAPDGRVRNIDELRGHEGTCTKALYNEVSPAADGPDSAGENESESAAQLWQLPPLPRVRHGKEGLPCLTGALAAAPKLCADVLQDLL